MLRKDTSIHKLNCIFRNVRCNYCKSKVIFNQLKQHLQECPEKKKNLKSDSNDLPMDITTYHHLNKRLKTLEEEKENLSLLVHDLLQRVSKLENNKIK